MLFAAVGGQGTGKTRAIKNLNPERTYIINCSNKPLTFPGSMAMYSEEQNNYFSTDSYAKVLRKIKEVQGLEHVKTLILDDIGFVMSEEFFARSDEGGYNKFGDIGDYVCQCKTLLTAGISHRDNQHPRLHYVVRFNDYRKHTTVEASRVHLLVTGGKGGQNEV